MQIAVTLTPGVSADECEAFTLAFSRVDGAALIGVGAEVGHVMGPGGRQRVDATFDEVRRPDVVLVPGGLGVDRVTHDEALLTWLRDVEPTCQWMAASSTGTVVVAAAGLLSDREAATHWLAGSRLEEFGSAASKDRIVEVGHILTCHGHISAMDVALLMIMRLYNRDTARRVRDEIVSGVGVGDHTPVSTRSWGTRILGSAPVRAVATAAGRLTTRRPAGRPAPRRNDELQTAEWIEMELVEDDDSRGRRSTHR